MKALVCCTLAVGTSLNLMAQKIATLPVDPSKIVRVETAADHLTVIEFSSPVTMVAVGNQDAFTVERRENKVFVKPAEEGAKTNLFVWTTAGRFAYELTPAATLEQADFAIDQPRPKPVALQRPEREKPEAALGLPPEILTDAVPILVDGERSRTGRVEVELRDSYRCQDRVYLRYAIINNSTREYRPAAPAVWSLTGVKSPQSLFALGGHQIDGRLARALKVESSAQLKVLDAGQPAHVPAGGESFGWLAVQQVDAIGAVPTVLKLQFADHDAGTVDAVLVLRRESTQQEVANARQAGN